MGNQKCNILVCSQVVAEETCQHSTCMDGNALGMSNGKNTVKNYSQNDKKKAVSTPPQFSEILTVSSSLVQLDNTEDLLMWLQQGFHVNHSVSQGQEKQTVIPETNGLQLLALLKQSNQDMYSSKTSMDYLAQKSQKTAILGHWYKPTQDLFGIWELFLESFPKSGMTQGTKLYQLRMSERRTKERDGGVSQKKEGVINWPAPTATDVSERSCENLVLNGAGTPRYKTKSGGLSQARLPEAVRYSEKLKREKFPTPTASDGTTGGIIGKNDTYKVLKSGAIRKITKHGVDGSIGLGRYVRLFPEVPEADSSSLSIPSSIDEALGKLNPEWVEWLMGWPIGWTSLGDLPCGSLKKWKEKTIRESWWSKEPSEVSRLVVNMDNNIRVSRLKALGNGQVPLTASTAKQILFNIDREGV